MPLIKPAPVGSKNFSRNVAEMVNSGHSQAQSVAAAYSNADEVKKCAGRAICKLDDGHDGDHDWADAEGGLPSGDTDKARRLGDLVKARRTLSDIARKPGRIRKMGAPDGSWERMLSQIGPVLIQASGCDHKPPMSTDDGRVVAGYSPDSHWVSVLGTFDDFALVGCDNEDKVWRIPFVMNDDGDITCGNAEEVEEVFVPVGDSA